MISCRSVSTGTCKLKATLHFLIYHNCRLRASIKPWLLFFLCRLLDMVKRHNLNQPVFWQIKTLSFSICTQTFALVEILQNIFTGHEDCQFRKWYWTSGFFIFYFYYVQGLTSFTWVGLCFLRYFPICQINVTKVSYHTLHKCIKWIKFQCCIINTMWENVKFPKTSL